MPFICSFMVFVSEKEEKGEEESVAGTYRDERNFFSFCIMLYKL